MKRIRMMGLCLVAVFATGAVTAASASAVPPEFVYSGLAPSFVGTSVGPVYIEYSSLTAGIVIKCSKETLEGEVEGTKKVEEVLIKFTGCKAAGSLFGKKQKCTVKSGGWPAGTIRFKVLDGELGKYPPAGSGKVGLDLKPEAPASTTF